MNLNALIAKIAEGYTTIINSNYPADNELNNFFRKNRNLGSKDRKIAAETIYGILRNKILLEKILCSANLNASVLNLINCYFIFLKSEYNKLTPINFEISILEEIIKKTDKSTVYRILSAAEKLITELYQNNNIENLSILYSLPEWYCAECIKIFGIPQAIEYFKSLKQSPPITIRVNTLKITTADCQKEILNEGYITQKTKYSDCGLIFEKRLNANNLKTFKNGFFEIQDEGSQLISILTNAQPQMKVLDACAGAGGKTLHLSALMKNKGLLYAADINHKRLENLKKRANRAGAFNIRCSLINEFDNDFKKKYKNFFDIVLIDAPCSGAGVFRRNPDAMFKLSIDDIKKINIKQFKILEYYSDFVKSDGALIYATCSILPNENQDIINLFLKDNKDWQILENKLLNNMSAKFLNLYPHLHNTDGFFAAYLKKLGS